MARAKWKIMRALCKSIANGSTYFAACKAAQVTETTLWRWRRSEKGKLGKTFGDLIQAIWDRRVATVEDAHYISAIKGSTKAQENFLNNRARGRWRKDPNTIIHVGDDNSKHMTQIFKSPPDRIVFDDGEGDRRYGLGGVDEVIPEDCAVTSADEFSRVNGEGKTECQESPQP